MTNADTMRADAALAARGLAPSRERARALIEAGLATVNGATIDKPSRKVSAGDVLAVTGDTHPYVSRGGLKLERRFRYSMWMRMALYAWMSARPPGASRMCSSETAQGTSTPWTWALPSCTNPFSPTPV